MVSFEVNKLNKNSIGMYVYITVASSYIWI